MFTKSHWIVYEGGLSFYNASNKPFKEIGKAITLSLNFQPWEKEQEKSLIFFPTNKRFQVDSFKVTSIASLSGEDNCQERKNIQVSF